MTLKHSAQSTSQGDERGATIRRMLLEMYPQLQVRENTNPRRVDEIVETIAAAELELTKPPTYDELFAAINDPVCATFTVARASTIVGDFTSLFLRYYEICTNKGKYNARSLYEILASLPNSNFINRPRHLMLWHIYYASITRLVSTVYRPGEILGAAMRAETPEMATISALELQLTTLEAELKTLRETARVLSEQNNALAAAAKPQSPAQPPAVQVPPATPPKAQAPAKK